MKPIYLYPNQDFINSMATALEDGIAIGEIRGEIKGKIEGKMKGKIEGKREVKIEISKRMLREGLDILLISRITGFAKSEIETLENE